MQDIVQNPPEKKEEKARNKLVAAMAITAQVTLLLIAPVGVCLGIGIWLDTVFKSSPIILTLGTIIGFIISMINVFRVMKMLEKIG